MGGSGKRSYFGGEAAIQTWGSWARYRCPSEITIARAMPIRDSPVPPVVLRRSRQSPPNQYAPGYLLQPCVPQADQAATLTLHPPGSLARLIPDVCFGSGRLRSFRPGYSPGRAS